MIAVDAVVVAAMPDEAAPFLARADVVGRPARAGHAEHHLLTLGGAQVLLVRCGIGLVNAATATAVAINGTDPAVVISAGSAGGVGADVRVGDVVAGSHYRYSGADARAFGYVLGQVPGMPEVYAAEESLVGATRRADIGDLELRVGTVLSGDAFIDETSIDRIRADFPGALSTDMESAAIAQTAHLYGVPFLSVRGISDLCGPVGEGEHVTHLDDAADRSARVVLALLRSLAAAVS